MASIIWTDVAQSNLIEIRAFVAMSSVIQADLLIDALFTKAQMLERYPEIGKIIRELPNENYREILFKRYRIIYKIQKDIVLIMSVWHSSRLLSNNPLFENDF